MRVVGRAPGGAGEGDVGQRREAAGLSLRGEGASGRSGPRRCGPVVGHRDEGRDERVSVELGETCLLNTR